ncbi:MAG: hypothetical protein ACYS7Y_36080 [Planctomycetota bacterium]|jgi:hypothetical protein
MTKTKACQILNSLKLDDGASVRYGTHLDGPGCARRGWARYSAAGDCTWLGRSALEVIENLQHPIDVWAAIQSELNNAS